MDNDRPRIIQRVEGRERDVGFWGWAATHSPPARGSGEAL